MAWGYRRVVTGHDAEGRSVFVSDGVPPDSGESPQGFGRCFVWHVPGPPVTPDSGGELPGEWTINPPPGAVNWMIMKLPPTGSPAAGDPKDPNFDPDRPGMHATDTIDLVYLLEGEIELFLDDSSVRLAAGDCVVQRGTMHAWQVLGDRPCVFGAQMLRSAAGGDPNHRGPGPRASEAPTGVGPRRVVTRIDDGGKSVFAGDGEPPNALLLEHGGGMAYVDIWQTLGPVHSPAAGGDAPPDSVELDPLGGGIAWKRVVIPPAAALAKLDGAKLGEEMRRRAPGMGRGGHHDPDTPGRHRTDTIDLVQILDGEITLTLDGDASVDLSAGDCVIQRGTWHTWTNRGNRPCVFQATLLTTDPLELYR